MSLIAYDVRTGEAQAIDPRFSALCLINGGFRWSFDRYPTDIEAALLQIRLTDAYKRGVTDDWELACAAVEAEGWKASLVNRGGVSVMHLVPAGPSAPPSQDGF